MSTRTVLDLRDVTLLHSDGEETVTALDAVNLQVAAGELIAVVGPSGSGKSSLLAVAGALTTPTSGTVDLADTCLNDLSAKELTAVRRERIGFVFQSGKVADARDPRELLARVGMEHRSGHRPHQLSGGERQRIGIARALVTRPELLLVDEPTAALDRQRSHEVVELLAREAHEHGVAAVMVTHDLDVLRHCDRVLEMIDGRLSPVAAEV